MMSLDAEQRQAVQSDARTLRVMAGAGSGKTRVLTQRVARRIEDESIDPAHTLVLTFTRKAADELRGRLRQGESGRPAVTSDTNAGSSASINPGSGVITGTFHAVAYAQLRRRWLDQGRSAPVVSSQPTRLLANVLDKLRLDRITNPRLVATEISWAKGRRLTPETYAEGSERYRRRPPISSNQMERIYAAYEAEKKKRRTVDYDDLLLLMADAIRNDRAFAATQAWQFRHFFVDEFQDLNIAQFDLLQAWMGNRDDLFVVGDPNQAIYGWNGADSTFLNSLDDYYPGLHTVRLGTNYRSSKSVLAAAHALMADATTAPVDAEEGDLPKVIAFKNEHDEADGIARLIRSAHHRNHRWSDIAVLVRTNAQRSEIEKGLENLSIPYRSAGGASWLYTSESRAALEYLRESSTALLIQRAPDLEQMAHDATEIERSYLQQLQMAVQSCLATDPSMTVADFLSWLDVGSRQDGPLTPINTGRYGGAVTVTTFHRAKGLEWPVVVLAGVEIGLVPISTVGVDEEKRLFYVAVTRAREELYCTWAEKRASGNGVSLRQPSPWLKLITGSAVASDVVAADVHEAITAGRESLHVDPAPVVSDGPRARLERWRAARAKLTGVDARLILGDSVLDEMINLRPVTCEALGSIEGFGRVRAAAIGDEMLKLLEGRELQDQELQDQEEGRP